MENDHVLRVHFSDGTSMLSGTIAGESPDKVDASFARDVNAGWQLGEGAELPDGRVIARVSAEHESVAVRSAA